MKFRITLIALFLCFLCVLTYGQADRWRVENFSTRDGMATNVANVVLQDRKGYLWFGTNYGLTRYDGYFFINYYYEPSGKRKIQNISDMVEDSLRHRLWLVGNSYEMLCFDLDKMCFVYDFDDSEIIRPDEYAHSLDQATAARLGIESRNKTGRRTKIHYATLPNDMVVYATLDNGIFLRNSKDGTMQHFLSTDSNPLLETDNLTNLLLDRSGCLWLTTWLAGVYKITLSDNSLQYYSLLVDDHEREGQSGSVRSFSELPDGSLAVSNMDGRLFKYDLQSGRQELLFKSASRIYSTASDSSGRLWIGTRGDGLWVDGRRIDDGSSFPGRQIYDILFENDKRVWLGTLDNGLWLAEIKSDGRYSFKCCLPRERVHEMCFDPSGRLWVVSEKGVFVGYKGSFRKVIGDIGALCVNTLSDGTVLVGSVGHGLVEIRGAGNTFSIKYLTKDDGLASNSVSSIIVDAKDNVYAATDAGLSYINRARTYIYNLYSSSGFLSDAYNENAAILTSRGHILFGCMSGIVEVVKKDDDMQLPAIVASITNMEVNDEPLIKGVYDNLQLSHSQNNLKICFSAFQYHRQISTLYSYWLEGFDKEWKQPTHNSMALYNNLKPGNYRFHIRAAFAGGPWGNESVCNIVISPPWWQTWWARLAFFAVLCGIGFYVYFTLRRIFRLHSDLEMERRLSAFKMDFFDRVQRELRGPANVLQGASEQVGLGGASKTTVRNIRLGSKRMLRLLDMVQRFTHLSRVEIEVQSEKDTMNEQTEQRFEEIRQSIHNDEEEYREMAPPAINPEHILVVSSDPDQLTHVVSTLNPYFNVVESDVLDISSLSGMDLVVADVSGQEAHALDYIRNLRKSPEKGKIPIFILSSIDDEQTEVRFFKAGADDYLTLPFSGKLLVERVMKLVQHSRSKKTVTGEMQVKPLSNSSERRFLDSLESVAYDNLASPDFNASELARKLHVGRTTLAKKMKELVGMSPADYISDCRFRKCLELLKESDLSIGEISYKCGFRNQSYFNLKFKERYGRSPRQVREEKPEETAKQ